MKRALSALLICLMLVGLLVPLASGLAAGNPEIVNGRFVETKHITVELYDRNQTDAAPPEDNFYARYIKEGVLRDLNIDVTYVTVPRWGPEYVYLNNLLAAGDAPDVCVTYDYPTIQTYANMGGVLDMAPHLEENRELLPNLWGLLGETNIYWDRDPVNGTIWAIEALLLHNTRISTFVREDWLKKLNLAEPTTLEEFEAMLKAFQENAVELLGEEADRMIPFSTSFDIGWRADHLLMSFVPNDLSDKDVYVYGFDDRHLLFPGYKEGVRKLNEWYNAGLIWKDFPLYPSGDATEDNLMKSGYVGAFIHNWDYPYRNGDDGVHGGLRLIKGEEAAYIAVEPFKNDAGVYKKYLSGPVDRKVFFPATNDEPLASLLYLDWISNVDNYVFLQIGEEGVTHEVLEDGAVQVLGTTGDKKIQSPYNIDYTITLNGFDLGNQERTIKSLALGYAGVDKRFIEKAYAITRNEGRIGQNVQVGEIKAQEGMGPALNEKRDTLLNQAVVAKPEDFDAVWDSGMADYLASGGQAIIDERLAAWEKYFGDSVTLP